MALFEFLHEDNNLDVDDYLMRIDSYRVKTQSVTPLLLMFLITKMIYIYIFIVSLQCEF